jgi:hypothetical protein
MAVDWPLNLIARECDFHLERNDIRNASPLSNTVQFVKRPGSRWVATYLFRRVGRAFGQRIDALIDSGDSFRMWDHGREYPLNGALSGAVTIGAAFPPVLGETSIQLTGLPSYSGPKTLAGIQPGDYIGISSRLYRIATMVSNNGSGTETYTLNRGLVAPALVGEPVVCNWATCEMILADNSQGARTVNTNKVYPFSLSFIEAVL